MTKSKNTAIPLTRAGQIKRGDIVHYEFRGVRKSSPVLAVLNHGSIREEIILKKKENIYFITSMVLGGVSWAKDVTFTPIAIRPTEGAD